MLHLGFMIIGEEAPCTDYRMAAFAPARKAVHSRARPGIVSNKVNIRTNTYGNRSSRTPYTIP